MALDPSPTQIFCQGCGAAWPASGPISEYPFLRFEPNPTLHPNQENTLGEIVAAGATLLSCPKDPIPDLDRAMRSGSDRNTAGDETDSRRG